MFKTASLLLLSVLSMTVAPDSGTAGTAPAAKPSGPLAFTVKANDGHDVDLSQYKGKVVLFVNTASKCGYTPQYKGLEELYKANKDKGFAVVAFPADNFGHQEPGTNEEIKTFCTSKYDVTFDLMGKVSVKGSDKVPLYQYLTSSEAGHAFGGEIKWNFTKFLIGKDGQLIGRFEPNTAPGDPALVTAVEAALAK